MFKRILLAAALLTPLTAATVHACPLCKESIPESEDGTTQGHDPERLSRAYNYSIFGVLGMMTVLGGGLGLIIYRNVKAGQTPPPQN